MEKKKKSFFQKIAEFLSGGLKSAYLTDALFWETEVQGNLLTGRVMFFFGVFLLLTGILDISGLVASYSASLYPLVFIAITLFIIPFFICEYFKGRRTWLKNMLYLCMVAGFAGSASLLTFHANLFIIFPVVLSSRYYNVRLTISVALISFFAFLLSAAVGPIVGMLDLNYLNLPKGTVITVMRSLRGAIDQLDIDRGSLIRNYLVKSFLPRYSMALVVSIVSGTIAWRGRHMVLQQNKMATDHARLDTEVDLASHIQLEALPKLEDLPEHPAYDLAAFIQPAKTVGGDFYDFMQLDDSHVVLLIADVSGKGVPASLFMMVSKMLLNTTIMSGKSPGRVLASVNHQLCDKRLEDMFVTVWLGILSLSTGRLVTANAGHEYPAICHKDGSFEIIHDKHGLVLGGMDGMHYKETELTLVPGDTLFVYTDGIVEEDNEAHELFGEQRMLDALNANCKKDLNTIIKGVLKSVRTFSGKSDQFDDMTMLAFRLNSLVEEEGITVTPDMSSVAEVEQYLEEQMDTAGIAVKDKTKMNIIIDEMYSNIVHYSGATRAQAILQVNESEIALILKDNGLPYDPTQKADPDVTLGADERKEGGLGIYMARKLSSDFDYQYINGFNTTTIKINRTGGDENGH